jgi:hypothetical protein
MGRSIHADDSILQVDDDESGFFESRFNEFNLSPKKSRIHSTFFFLKYEDVLDFVKFSPGEAAARNTAVCEFSGCCS